MIIILLILLIIAFFVIAHFTKKRKTYIISDSFGTVIKKQEIMPNEGDLQEYPYGEYTVEVYEEYLYLNGKEPKNISKFFIVHNKINSNQWENEKKHRADTRKYALTDKTKQGKGTSGEYIIEGIVIRTCKNAYYKTLNNIYLCKNDKQETTEIDCILMHPTGIYVFESKNYSGWIFGNEKNFKWTQSLYNPRFKKAEKFQFLNPILQNELHIKALKSQLQNEYIKIRSYIVFGKDSALKKVPSSTDTVKIIRIDELYTTLLNDIEISQKNLSEDSIDSIYNTLQSYTNVSEEIKLKHIQDIQKNT